MTCFILTGRLSSYGSSRPRRGTSHSHGPVDAWLAHGRHRLVDVRYQTAHRQTVGKDDAVVHFIRIRAVCGWVFMSIHDDDDKRADVRRRMAMHGWSGLV